MDDRGVQIDVQTASTSAFTPAAHCRRWLLIGSVALLVDLIAGVAATVLEFRHWGDDGFTPDIVLAYAALLPQMFMVAAYLVLARDANVRGLWKSTAGMAGTYLLVCLLGLALMEVLSAAGNVAVMVAVAFGILGLLGFSISGIPRFAAPSDPVSDLKMPVEETGSSGIPGWIGGFVMFIAYLVMRGLFRRFIRPLLGEGFAADDWAMMEFFALVAFGVSFAIWFAITKIRQRQTLGRMACVTGWAELLILLFHAGLAITILVVIMNTVAVNPQIDEDGIDRLLDPWMKRGSLLTAASHAVWAVLTFAFFVSLRMRSDQHAGHQELRASR